MNINMRQANIDDLDGILDLYAQPDFDNESVLTESEAKTVFAEFSKYPNYRLFVALDGVRLIGTFALLVMHNLGHRGTPSAIAEDVVVSRAYQGKGIGRIMMAHAIDLARQAGCYKLVLSSNLKRKNAHVFYESLGFTQHGLSFVINTQHE